MDFNSYIDKFKIGQLTDNYLTFFDILFGSALNEDDIRFLNKCCYVFTVGFVPLVDEIKSHMSTLKNLGNRELSNGLTVIDMDKDVWMAYEYYGRTNVMSFVGFYNMMLRLFSEVDNGIFVVQSSLRVKRNYLKDDLIGTIRDYCNLCSVVGEKFGIKPEVDVDTTMSPGYTDKKDKGFCYSMNNNKVSTFGIYLKILGFYMMNMTDTVVDTKYISTDEMLMNALSNVKTVRFTVVCPHSTEPEVVPMVEFLDDLEMVEEVLYEKKEDDLVHYGQMKLLIGNLMFLKRLKERLISFENVYFLGSASSHSVKATVLFLGKDYNYFCIDPAASEKFYQDLLDEGYFISTFSEVVTSDFEFEEKSVLISDIRGDIQNKTDEEKNLIIEKDNDLQISLSKKVRASSLKFKVPYDTNRSKKVIIPVGDLFLQPFRGYSSQEVRIFNYDPGIFRSIMSGWFWTSNDFYNFRIRRKGYMCQDCRIAQGLFDYVSVPMYAKIIVPEYFDVSYDAESSYKNIRIISPDLKRYIGYSMN